VIESEKAK
jgi:hypothetical protein